MQGRRPFTSVSEILLRQLLALMLLTALSKMKLLRFPLYLQVVSMASAKVWLVSMPRLHTSRLVETFTFCLHIETSTGLTKDQLDTLTSLIDERK